MTFEESVVIASDPAALFRLSQDYDRRLEWDPFLRSARLSGAAREAGAGVQAVCVAPREKRVRARCSGQTDE
jgi:hypothetical protein